MAIVTFQRYERKFLVTKAQYARMLPQILLHMTQDAYCISGKGYKICNIYYDTEANDVIRRSISKPRYKEKLRLRSYDVPKNEDAIVYLEIKKKIEKMVTKRRIALTVAEAERFIRDRVRPVREDYLSKQIIGEIEAFLFCYDVAPKTYISYERMAFFDSENEQIRLTFDDHIKTRRDHVSFLAGDDGELLLPEGMLLMEMKVPDAIPLWLARILSEEGIYQLGFSKYGKAYEQYVRSRIELE